MESLTPEGASYKKEGGPLGGTLAGKYASATGEVPIRRAQARVPVPPCYVAAEAFWRADW